MNSPHYNDEQQRWSYQLKVSWELGKDFQLKKNSSGPSF